MTTQEIKIKGFRLFENTAIAMMNVANGCSSDQSLVNENMPRLITMVKWFRDNNLFADFEYFVTSGKFNTSQIHFYTTKLFTEITK